MSCKKYLAVGDFLEVKGRKNGSVGAHTHTRPRQVTGARIHLVEMAASVAYMGAVAVNGEDDQEECEEHDRIGHSATKTRSRQDS